MGQKRIIEGKMLEAVLELIDVKKKKEG